MIKEVINISDGSGTRNRIFGYLELVLGRTWFGSRFGSVFGGSVGSRFGFWGQTRGSVGSRFGFYEKALKKSPIFAILLSKVRGSVLRSKLEVR